MPHDPFAGLYPPDLDRLRVAWDQLCTPGPPADYALSAIESHDPDPVRRFARRTIQQIACGGDRLALIDKALPHSLFDLMVSEVSPNPKTTPDAVEPMTGRLLWQSGLAFVRFVSDPDVMQRFDLCDGELHLALNCDPNTADRESVQAAKQFHLHLLYWPGQALHALDHPGSFGLVADSRLRRQCIDPLAFLGAHLIEDALSGFALGIPGARLAPSDDRSRIRGDRPLGALIELPGWAVLADPAFEDLIRRLHRRLDRLAADLLQVFTGQREPPPPWQRHQLRPYSQIVRGLAALPLSAGVQAGCCALASALQDLPPTLAGPLSRMEPVRRMHRMTLNQPCYALNLHAPVRNRPGAPLSEAAVVHLTVQPKLFSGIGGAGLLTLAGIPSVRILRGQGAFSVESWHRRAAFQRGFAGFNQMAGQTLGHGKPAAQTLRCNERNISFEPVGRFLDPRRGWVIGA